MVPDDVILLRTGDIVPADVCILSTNADQPFGRNQEEPAGPETDPEAPVSLDCDPLRSSQIVHDDEDDLDYIPHRSYANSDESCDSDEEIHPKNNTPQIGDVIRRCLISLQGARQQGWAARLGS